MRFNAHILTQKREPLEKVIPLDTPFTVLIELSRVCNFHCVFCPQSDRDHFPFFSDNFLNIQRFNHILTQMKEFPQKIKKVYLHGTGESMLNPALPEIINLLKKSSVTEYIDLTSNGSLLTENLSHELVEAGLDHLHISVEGLSSKQYEEVTGVQNFDFDKLVNNIQIFYNQKKNCRVSIKIASTSLKSEKDKERFFQIFTPLCDEIFIENIFPIWPSFDFSDIQYSNTSVKGQYGQAIMEKQVCPQIFTVLAIKCDGSVSPCSVDWNNQIVLGNISSDTLKDIWQGESIRALRLKHLQSGRKTISACSTCGLPKYSCIDNLDPFREQLYTKIDTAGGLVDNDVSNL